MKKIIIILVMILFTSGCFNKEEQIDNYKANNNIDVISEKQYENVKINNISLLYRDNLSTLSFDITNTSNDKVTIYNIEAILKISNGDILTTLSENINTTIEVGESINATLISDIDLTDAVKLEYNIK